MKSKAKANLSKLVEKFEQELTAKGSQKDQIHRQIDKTDREIDEIVYNLYGITAEEKKIIDATLLFSV